MSTRPAGLAELNSLKFALYARNSACPSALLRGEMRSSNESMSKSSKLSFKKDLVNDSNEHSA